MKVNVDEVKLDKDFYPRFGLDNETVNLYMLNLVNLPPISITKEMELIDGYHRLTAHKAAGLKDIEAEILDISKEAVLVEAIKRNALHGKQLTKAEKKSLTIRLYEQEITQEEIGKVLSIAQPTISGWLHKKEQAKKEEQERQIVELYLQDYTQEEIANQIGLTRGRITQIVNNIKSDILENPPNPSHIWLHNYRLIPKLGNGRLNYPGNLPPEIVENVLYYWTEPFDLIVDPMAGGGSTIDVCKKLYRRYKTTDIKPIRDDVEQWDLTKGYPLEAKNCNLIFLDPPYYKKIDYGEQSVSSLDRDNFLKFTEKLAKDSFKTIKKGGYVALIISDYLDYENATQSILTPEYYTQFKKVGFTPINHIQLPLSTEQWSPTDVERAKEKKILLAISRDLYIFRREN